MMDQVTQQASSQQSVPRAQCPVPSAALLTTSSVGLLPYTSQARSWRRVSHVSVVSSCSTQAARQAGRQAGRQGGVSECESTAAT